MPLYQMRCQLCQKECEEFFHPTADAKKKCECGGEMKKLLSAGSFRINREDTYYNTVGKVCGTEREYQREADKLKYRLEKERNLS